MQASLRPIATRWLDDRATRTLFSSDMFTHVWRPHADGPWIITDDGTTSASELRSFLLNTRYWWWRAHRQSRSRKSAQGDKWSFCLAAGTLCLRIRGDHDETTPPEPHSVLQGEGCACGHQGRSDHRAACRAVRRAPEPDHIVEGAAGGAASTAFGHGGGNGAERPAVDVKSLHAKIGELTLENDFLEGALTKAGLLSAKR